MSEAPPLSILQVLRAPVGGLFRHVRDLTAELARRGHRLGVVADSLTADALTAERLAEPTPFAVLGIHRRPMPRLVGWPTSPRRWPCAGWRGICASTCCTGTGEGRLRGPAGALRHQVALNTPHGAC